MAEYLTALGILTSVYIADYSKKKKEKTTNNKLYKDERSPLGFTKSVKDIVKMITFSNDMNNLAGSYRYRIHAYPSDIDLFEKVEECCNVENATLTISKKLQQIGKNIQKNKLVFLGDFKAGILDELLFDYGHIDYQKKLSVVGYNRSFILEKLEEFKNQGWITSSELTYLRKLAKPTLKIAEFAKLHKELRELHIVRWSLEELIKGQKKTRLGSILTLKEAISHKGIVKIDVWAPINNRYTEITNFYYLILKGKDGKETIINQEFGDYMSALMEDINKYASSIFRNSLKVAKRLWIVNKLKKEKAALKKLYPLFFSGVASLNQVKEEAIVIVDMLEDMEKKNSTRINQNYKLFKPILMDQIDEFKKRINDIYDIQFNRDDMFSILDKSLTFKTKAELKKMLKKFIELCKPVIERESVNYLNENKVIKIIPRKPGDDILDDVLENYKILF